MLSLIGPNFRTKQLFIISFLFKKHEDKKLEKQASIKNTGYKSQVLQPS